MSYAGTSTPTMNGRGSGMAAIVRGNGIDPEQDAAGPLPELEAEDDDDEYKPEADTETLAKLRDWFQTSDDSCGANRTEAERARDYYDGRQLTSEEVGVLQARGQPPVVDNRIKPKVNYLLGMEKRGRTDPKAFPRNPVDQAGANAATDAIRFVCDDNLFENIASEVCENMLIEGFGGVDVIVEREDDDVKICIEHYPWDRLFYDPHSRRFDFGDAKYVGGVIWMDEDGVRARWGKAKAALAVEGAYAYMGTSGDTYDDRPKMNIWADFKRKRVRVIQIHWTEGEQWYWATFTAGGFLDDPQKSPYVCADGDSACSLVMHASYVDRRNWRYGIIRDMFDPQDEINKRRSKALHLLSVRQIVAEHGAVLNVDEARREMARPDGYVEVTPGMRFEIQQTQDLAQGQFLLLQEAKASLEAVGPNAFLTGTQTQAASGRAVMASQQGGAIAIDGAAMDRFHQFKHRVYVAIWDRVKQFWTEEKWIRVTDDETNVRFVGLNRPMTVEDKLMSMPPAEAQYVAQQAGIGPGDPRLKQIYIGEDGQPELANNVAQLTVDIVIDEAPDVATLQSEQFQMLTDLASKMPGLISGRAIIEASALRDKDKILKSMEPPKGPDGQPLPPPPPPEIMKMQAEMQLKQQAQQAEMQTAQAKAQLDAQTAQQSMQIEAQKAAQQASLDAQKAQSQIEIDRQKAASDIQIAQIESAAKIELAREEAAAKARAQAMLNNGRVYPERQGTPTPPIQGTGA